MSKYLNSTIVGIDVASEFSYVAILCPDGHEYRKPFKLVHTRNGFNYLLETIKKVENEFNMKPIFFMESTGVYHLTLLHFLRDNKFEAFVINPLVTNSNKNKDIRKVKSDKRDALNIAKLGKYDDIRVSSDTDVIAFEFKQLVRNYYRLIDNRADYKKQMSSYLTIYFNGYKKVFRNICCDASIRILKKYPTPNTILNAPKEDIINLLLQSKKGMSWSEEKYRQLIKCADEATFISVPSCIFDTSLQSFITLYELVDDEVNSILSSIKAFIKSGNLPSSYAKNISLLQSITGIGFICAVTLVAEIGSFEKFKSPKQLVGFIGIDPAVNESGEFKGDRVKMSKRGSRYARRALFAATLTAIRTKNNVPENPVIHEYYKVNLKGKKKKVALVAVMHKLTKYLFAVMRDQKPYTMQNPKEHQVLFLKNHHLTAA